MFLVLVVFGCGLDDDYFAEEDPPAETPVDVGDEPSDDESVSSTTAQGSAAPDVEDSSADVEDESRVDEPQEDSRHLELPAGVYGDALDILEITADVNARTAVLKIKMSEPIVNDPEASGLYIQVAIDNSEGHIVSSNLSGLETGRRALLRERVHARRRVQRRRCGSHGL